MNRFSLYTYHVKYKFLFSKVYEPYIALYSCWSVMQFGGQHPGGIGVPAVGMAFPGYVAQPQGLGIGNSEMTWYMLFTILAVFLY